MGGPVTRMNTVVLYAAAPGYVVAASRREIEDILDIADEYDALVFWQKTSTGQYIVALLPRYLWESPQG